MTEVQVTINNLKTRVEQALNLVARLEKVQTDSEKPPPHKWKHGDVFLNEHKIPMIYIKDVSFSEKEQQIFCLSGCGCDCQHHSADFLPKGQFLFNIQEKL